MDLFNTSKNLLPYDGIAHYFGPVISNEAADRYFRRLLKDILWENDQLFIFGRNITTKRKVGWYGDSPYAYTYSKSTKMALPWIKELLELKSIIEKKTKETYNSCLLNLYHNGDEGMGWHSDDEKELKENGAIASLSLGAERKFKFKHKSSNQTVDILLESGSLLLMQEKTQAYWLHCLPKTKKISTPRINLTFRTIHSYLRQ